MGWMFSAADQKKGGGKQKRKENQNDRNNHCNTKSGNYRFLEKTTQEFSAGCGVRSFTETGRGSPITAGLIRRRTIYSGEAPP